MQILKETTRYNGKSTQKQDNHEFGFTFVFLCLRYLFDVYSAFGLFNISDWIVLMDFWWLYDSGEEEKFKLKWFSEKERRSKLKTREVI